jgi:hypothetical protein
VTGDVGGEAAAQPGRRRPAIVPDPVIVVLLLIAFFSAISGKPLDGGLTLLVAAGLARDVRTRGRHIPASPAASEPPSAPVPDAAPAAAPAPRRGIRRLAAAAAVAGGACYAVIAGSFSRFSWPATAAVVSVGALVVLGGWLLLGWYLVRR